MCVRSAATALSTLPLDKHTTISNSDFGGMIAYRLCWEAPVLLGGVGENELPPDLGCGACKYGGKMDVFHGAACMGTGCRTRIHNAISHQLKNILTEASFGVSTEPSGFLLERKRPDLHISAGGVTIASDHSIVCAHSNQHAAVVASAPGAHIKAAEATKNAKYSKEYSRDWSMKFFPVVLDAAGGRGKGVDDFSQSLQHTIKVNGLWTPKPRSYLVPTFSSYIKRVLSIAAAAGTSRAIRECFRRALEARGRGSVCEGSLQDLEDVMAE